MATVTALAKIHMGCDTEEGTELIIFGKKKVTDAPNPGKWPSGRSGGLLARRNTRPGQEKNLGEKY